MKNVINGTKSVRANKKCSVGKNGPISRNKVHKRPMREKCYLLTHYGVELPFVAWYGSCYCILQSSTCLLLCGLAWPCMSLFEVVWPYVAFSDIILFLWPLYGVMWSFMAQYCLFSRS